MFDRETAVTRISYGAPVKRVGFRGRLFLILLAFALIPSILISHCLERHGLVRASVRRGDRRVGQRRRRRGERAIDATARGAR